MGERYILITGPGKAFNILTYKDMGILKKIQKNRHKFRIDESMFIVSDNNNYQQHD